MEKLRISRSWQVALAILSVSSTGILLPSCSESFTESDSKDSGDSGGAKPQSPVDAAGGTRSDGGADPGDGGAGGGDSSKGVDRDGDGIDDSLGVAVDEDGNGRFDAVDVNEDGEGDYLLVDTNADGIADGYAVDTNGDGIADQFRPFVEDIPDGQCVNEDGEIKDGRLGHWFGRPKLPRLPRHCGARFIASLECRSRSQ